MSKGIGFQKDLSLYLFLSGIGSLFIVPFLTWYNYGLILDWTTFPPVLRTATLTGPFPSEASLFWLFENGYRFNLTLYLLGVAATIVIVGTMRRPVFFQGIIPALFPSFTVFVAISASLAYHFPGYLQVLTDGIFTAFLGSVLLEASYFSYRHKIAKIRSATALTSPHQ
ncbi:MAG: hypothetical protein PXY39_11530 [archaeon]|nr:hypothetical protein [archaeon]